MWIRGYVNDYKGDWTGCICSDRNSYDVRYMDYKEKKMKDKNKIKVDLSEFTDDSLAKIVGGNEFELEVILPKGKGRIIYPKVVLDGQVTCQYDYKEVRDVIGTVITKEKLNKIEILSEANVSILPKNGVLYIKCK